MKCYLVAAAALIAIAGCASTPPADQANAGPGQNTASAGNAAAPRTAGTPAAAVIANDAGKTNTATVPSQRSVYFDYDSNVVKEEFAPVVQANARYVGQQRGARVTIAGNTDERGSREYNLALGQRRAEAVKQRMTLLGVPAQQIEAVSFGEEKPRSDANSEQAYAENRRADIAHGK